MGLAVTLVEFHCLAGVLDGYFRLPPVIENPRAVVVVVGVPRIVLDEEYVLLECFFQLAEFFIQFR